MLGFAVGYLAGSIPTAFLLVRWKFSRDVRHSGSGNVGALNSFHVTGSKLMGLSVMLLDALKGAAAVIIASSFGDNFWVPGAAGIGTVLGHNYSPWIRFKGGRGLAPAAGVLLVLSWLTVILWCLIWTLARLTLKNTHLANVTALVASPLAVLAHPSPFSGYPADHALVPFFCILCALILLRHVEPIVALWHSHKISTKS